MRDTLSIRVRGIFSGVSQLMLFLVYTALPWRGLIVRHLFVQDSAPTRQQRKVYQTKSRDTLACNETQSPRSFSPSVFSLSTLPWFALLGYQTLIWTFQVLIWSSSVQMRVGLHLTGTQFPLSVMLCIPLRSHGGISEAGWRALVLEARHCCQECSYISSDSDIPPW